MSLESVLATASSGLASINSQFSVISQNVSNADSPGYAVEVETDGDATADGMGAGVRTGRITRVTDETLTAALYQQNATVAGLTARQAALQKIDAVQGTVGDGDDLASLVGDLEDALSTLNSDTTSDAAQQKVVASAQSLAGQLNTLSTALGSARQDAQNAIVIEVGTINGTLATIGGLNGQIVALRSEGKSTADLENQRDAALSSLSSLISFKVLQQSDGNVVLTTAGGLAVPTNAAEGPLATEPATVNGASPAPAVTLDGLDITGLPLGGELGANITLRDTTFPAYAAQVDAFASQLATASAFHGSDGGVTLFSLDASAPAASIAANASALDSATSDDVAAALAYFDGSPSLAAQATDVVNSESQASAATTASLTNETATQSTLKSQVAAVSGVSIDQQMATMIALENAYAANAKIISTVQAMWTDLIQAS